MVAALIAAIVPTVLGYVLVQYSAAGTGGQFIYFMDDAYIHMGVAKNLLLNGTVGINEKSWTSLSSSPIYTIVLTLQLWATDMSSDILWHQVLLVWFLGATVSAYWFRRLGYTVASYGLFIGLMAVVLPITLNFLNGMEHLFHAWLACLLLLVWHGPADNTDTGTDRLLPILVLSSLALLTRFETLFLTGALAAIDLYTGRYRRAVGMLLLTAAIPLAYMSFMWAQGATFLPNSMAAKSALDTSSLSAIVKSVVFRSGGKLYTADKFTAILAALLVLGTGLVPFLRHKAPSARPLLVAALCAIPIFLLAQPESHRYDMWVNALFVLAFVMATRQYVLKDWPQLCVLLLPFLLFGLVIQGYLPRKPLWELPFLVLLGGYVLFLTYKVAAIHINNKAVLASVAAALLLTGKVRCVDTLPQLRGLAQNIYNQQYAFALFVDKYYPGRPVLLNDIGTTSFAANNPIVDWVGLGTTELLPVGKKWFSNKKEVDIARIDAVVKARHAALGVVYPKWIGKKLPANWVLAATWTNTVNHGKMLGDTTVGFYAFSVPDAKALQQKLVVFEKENSFAHTLRLLPIKN